MSATSLRVLKGQIDRGVADLATIDAWQAKKTVTAAEADEARTYWHTLNDPPPPVEPTPTTPDVTEPPVAGQDAEPTTSG